MRKLRRLLICGTVLPVMLAAVCVESASPPGSLAVDRAATLYRLRVKQPGAIDQAIAILDELLESEPGRYDALWMQSRNYWYKGYRGPKRGRIAWLERARKFAERAIEVKAGAPEGHYWLAMILGVLGQEKGILNCLFLAKPIERELNLCISIDSGFDEAYRALAELYWRAPSPPLSLGNRRKASEMIQRAIKLNESFGEYWLLYAEILFAERDYGSAQMALEKVLSLPDDEEDPVASRQCKQRAGAMLAEVQTKTFQPA